MAKYFDEQKWTEAIKRHTWYLFLAEDLLNLNKKAQEGNGKITQEIKDEVYSFFENHLANGDIMLGRQGPNWDQERKPIDTVVIHHTRGNPNITQQRLSAMHLIRLYALYYASPTYEPDKYIKGQPIYSNHFRDGKQVFYAYHWLVRMNGDVERLLPDNETGWHAGNWEVNCRSVAICLDNNYENSSPSDVVLSATAKIIKENYGNVDKKRIFGHREINPKKTCPGNLFLDGWKGNLLEII
ncbi:MAG: peptidoglycan recognition family protein [bacterium]|nr:peptidoglycan recognition family protein [bacterium]